MLETRNVLVRFGYGEGEDIAEAVQPISVQCLGCEHYADSGLRCHAYPGGIPHTILAGRVDHTKPYAGDRGIRFAPVKVGNL